MMSLGGGIGFGVGVVAVVAIGILASLNLASMVATSEWVAHTHEALIGLAALDAEVLRGVAASRLHSATGSEQYLAVLEAARRGSDTRLAELARLVAENPGQVQRLPRLKVAMGRAMDGGGAATSRDVHAVLAEMTDEEQRLLTVRERAARASARRTSLILAGGTVLATGALLGAALSARRLMRARMQAEAAVRASETMYRTVARHFPNGALLLFDRDLRFTMADGTGLHPGPEAFLGKTLRETIPAELCDVLEPFYRAALAGQPGSVEVTRLGRRRMVHLVPVRDGEEEITAGLVMSQDVTERHEAEEKVRQLNAQLERSVRDLKVVNEELEAFSYSVSHDLRAPLRHIHGFVDLLQRRAADALDETSRRHLATIAGAARQMGQLIDDLLAFSRMGRTELLQSRVPLATLVASVRDSLRDEARGRDVVWRLDGLPEVEGDPEMLRVAVGNLLSNALKYSRTRARAEIEVGWRPGADRQAVVFVRDNGVGFDMQYAGKLFGVFQRLHRAAEFEGTGIGLATVRRIVHRHGGRTWAEGAVEQGATVYFSLPLYTEAAG